MVTHTEAWRFHTGGQFNHLRAVSADWRTGTEATYVPPGFESVIEVWETLYYLTELYELGARLSLGPAGDESMEISARLAGLGRRALVVGQQNRVEFMDPYGPPPDVIDFTVVTPRDELIGDGRNAAVATARDFFLRFGWTPSETQLADFLRQLIR